MYENIHMKSNGNYLEPFLVDDKRDNVSWDSNIKDWIELLKVKASLKPALANYVHGSWKREKPWPNLDSKFDSTSDFECSFDSDIDLD